MALGDGALGIVGAGLMGRSIALRALQNGLAVRLYDNNETALAVAAAALREAANTAHEHLRTVDALSQLADCTVLIEAVIENRSVKRRLLKSLSGLTSSALVASNTSSLSIGELAESVSQPGRFCGLHFCHPIVECPLVEIVPGPETVETSLLRAETFVQRLQLEPLRTRDVPGFAVNRLLFPYFEAAIALARGGVDWVRIECCATEFGMRLGPLSQMDEIGIDVILRAAAAFHRGNPVVPPQSELLLAMYQSDRRGRKSGRGFFDDSASRPLTPDPHSLALCAKHATAGIECDDSELTLRLFVPMFAAACDLLERRVVSGIAGVRAALGKGLSCRRRAADLGEWGRQIGPDRLTEWRDRLDLPAFNPDVLCTPDC